MTCINVTTQCLNTNIDVDVSVIDELNVSVHYLNDAITVNAYMIGRLIIICQIVCGKTLPYLDVQPDYVWLTPDMLSGEFDIYSNVVWKID